jgi:GT2 family glycosyltransferase
MADFTFAIVSWNTKDLLRNCLQSVLTESGDFDVQILVADNGSEDGSADMVADEFPRATLVRHDRNLGFAAAHESLFSLSRGRYHVLVNSDVRVEPGCLRSVDERMRADGRIGVLGPQIIGPDGGIQTSCRRFPSLRRQLVEATGIGRLFPRSRLFNGYKMGDFDHRSTRGVDQVMGSFFVIRRSVLEEVGHLDTRFFMYYEEVDYCLRTHRAGYNVFFDPAARVRHEGGASSDKVRVPTIRRQMRSMHHYFRKHRGAWVYLPLLGICALDGVIHTLHSLVTGRNPRETVAGYWLGWWDVFTARSSREP